MKISGIESFKLLKELHSNALFRLCMPSVCIGLVSIKFQLKNSRGIENQFLLFQRIKSKGNIPLMSEYHVWMYYNDKKI